MQKKLLLYVVCFTLTGVVVHAQKKEQDFTTIPAPPEPPVLVADVPAPPPPPPPVPPLPPLPPSPDREIAVNSNGYDISVITSRGMDVVVVERDGVKQRIKMSTWNANRKYYEKKYGKLPPPPPPPAPPAPPAPVK
ncbi:MAG: hypothetical protein JST81_09015 [Bacteroidetes bacterium]|jgi:hypothetical protein|nr:hypothetical protein [Bacteroidota bacterium]